VKVGRELLCNPERNLAAGQQHVDRGVVAAFVPGDHPMPKQFEEGECAQPDPSQE